MPRIAARIPSGMNIRVIGRLVVTVSWVIWHRPAPTQVVSSVPIESATTSQIIDGFGFLEAFQRSNELHSSPGLSEALHQQVLDLLFNPYLSAGFTILRTIIDPSADHAADHIPTIQPHRPGTPWATPAYVWEGSDQSQIWLSHQAQRSGVTQISADAWSKLGLRKTNGSDSSGGTRCDVPGAGRAGTDWRSMYSALKRSSACLCTVLPDSFVPL